MQLCGFKLALSFLLAASVRAMARSMGDVLQALVAATDVEFQEAFDRLPLRVRAAGSGAAPRRPGNDLYQAVVQAPFDLGAWAAS